MCAQSRKKKDEENSSLDIKQVTVSPFPLVLSLQVTMKIDKRKKGKEKIVDVVNVAIM